MKRTATLAVALALAGCGDEVGARVEARVPTCAPARRASRAALHPSGGGAADVDDATRRLTALVDDVCSKDPSVRAAAVESLRAAGDAAVPALLARYYDAASEWTGRDALVRLLVERREVVLPDVLARIDASADRGERAKPLRLLEYVGMSGGLGERVEQVVTTLLRHTDDDVALRLLGMCGAAAERAVPDIARLIGEQPDREAPYAALAALGPRARAALPALLDVLAHRDVNHPAMDRPDPGSYELALQTIRFLGPAAVDAAEALADHSRIGNASQRCAALEALGDIGVDSDFVSSAIAAGLRIADTTDVAIRALRKLAFDTPEIREAVADAMRKQGEFEDEGWYVSYGEPTRDLAATFASMAERNSASAESAARVLTEVSCPWELADAIRGSDRARDAVVPLLRAMSQSSEPDVRMGVLRALVSLRDPTARSVALDLLPSAQDEERVYALCALTVGGPPDTETVRALANAAADPDPMFAATALDVLRRLGPSAAAAAPQVAARVGDADLHDHALDALACLGVVDERTARSVNLRLDSDDDDLRVGAARVLGETGALGSAEIPRVVALLMRSERDSWQGRAYAQTLARLGAVAPIVNAIRQGLLTSRDASDAFALVPPPAADAVAGFTADDDARVRVVVATWLGARGGARAEEPLVRMLADPDADVRGAAATACAGLPWMASPSVDALRQVAFHDDFNVRFFASTSLVRWDTDAAARSLFDLLVHAHDGRAWPAGEALTGMGASARAVAPRLVEVLRPPLDRARACLAMRTLKSFPVEARTATPELAAIVSRRVSNGLDGLLSPTEVASDRVRAAELLGAFGGAGAGDALREALLDPSRDVRDAAAAALARLGER